MKTNKKNKNKQKELSKKEFLEALKKATEKKDKNKNK